MTSLKSFEKKMLNTNKAQMIGEVVKYGLVGLVSVIILIFGYSMINSAGERTCKVEIAKFEIDLKGIDKSLRYGAKELQSHNVPCNADEIYFLDLNKNIDPENFKDIFIINDALKSGGNNNIFLVKHGDVARSFYAGSLDIPYPYYICFIPLFNRISFFIESTGKSARITSADGQPECTMIPVKISSDEADNIIKEAFEFGQQQPSKCTKCPTDTNSEKQNMELTKNNVDIFRIFSLIGKKIKVEIIIRPKEGLKLSNFKFYEYIPKECISDLQQNLGEIISRDATLEIKSDPLIIWSFSEIKGEKKISYQLNELSEDCKPLIKGLGIAQSIEKA